MVIHKYLINTELYLTFSKYGDKLLVVKSLINILKFTDICGLMNNLKTFNVYALMLVGTFIDTLVWGSYGSVQDRIKVYGNCIKVSKIV